MSGRDPDMVSAPEILARARALVPLLKARAQETERQRVVPADLFAAIRASGLFRTCRPRRFGGFAHDPEVVYDMTLTLAGGCASTAWCAMGATVGDWMLAAFPLQAQQDVWDENRDAITCGVFAPTARAVPVAGGYRVNGRWGFASGCDHAHWSMLGALVGAEGAAPTPSFLLLPAAAYAIEDNWFTSGLSGTGSKTLIASDAFVPSHRVLSFADATAGTGPGAAAHDNPIFGIPVLAVFPANLAATAIGAAKGALEHYTAAAQARETRGAIAGGRMRMADFATVQLRVAEAAAACAGAELILRTDIREATAMAHAGTKPGIADRIRYRRGQAFAVKLAVAAVEALNGATGGAGLALDNPVQRAWRDANAVARHISLNWDAVGTMYGQHVLGLEPVGQY